MVLCYCRLFEYYLTIMQGAEHLEIIQIHQGNIEAYCRSFKIVTDVSF